MQPNWQEDTAIGGWAISIARTLDHYQLDSEAVFKSCGLNLSQALDTNSRYPITKISRVLNQAVALSGDENLGLLVAKYTRPTSWHALGISIWASDSMASGYQRLVRYRRMFNTALEIELTEQDDTSILAMRFPEAYRPLLCYTDIDAIMATTVLTSRYLADGAVRPRLIRLCRPRPANPAGFERLFRCPVLFSCQDNQIVMNSEDLHAPMLTANAELAMLNDGLIQQYLARMEQHDIINRVYHKLMETLGQDLPDQAQLAHSLHLSQRSLQRKLQQSGTSYQAILDQLRKELSIQYLQQSHLSINEISYRLGFAKVGSFSRAFQSWHGCSPSAYRQQQAESDHSTR